MTTDVILPKIGFTMDEATIAEWLVNDGTAVTAGQPLYTIESDKSTTEVDAPATGVLTIIGPAGDTFSVGAVIARIE